MIAIVLTSLPSSLRCPTHHMPLGCDHTGAQPPIVTNRMVLLKKSLLPSPSRTTESNKHLRFARVVLALR